MTTLGPATGHSALPVPRPLSLMRRLWQIADNVLPTYPPEAYETGCITWRRMPWWSELLVSDPAGVKRVLVDHAANYIRADLFRALLQPALGNGLFVSDGEIWRRHRRIMAPSFDPRSILAYVPVITAASEQMVAEWSALAPDDTVDIAAAMSRLTLEIISRTMFSSSADDVTDLAERGVGAYQSAVMRTTAFDFLKLPAWIGRVVRERAVRRTLGAFDTTVRRLIAERAAAASHGPHDFLALLITAADEETGRGMTVQEVRDQVATIFMAGHETTALALTWAWYLLALHPEWEARLHTELDEVLGGKTPTRQDIERLVVTRMIIDETMRLYPPVHAISRQAVADDEICGHRVTKGALIRISPWVIHRHRRLWNDPERFDPERFAAARSTGRPRFAYMPFGAGPHICIGATFAIAEGVLALAILAQHYRLRLAPGHKVEPQGLITVRPRHGMRMTIVSRV